LVPTAAGALPQVGLLTACTYEQAALFEQIHEARLRHVQTVDRDSDGLVPISRLDGLDRRSPGTTSGLSALDRVRSLLTAAGVPAAVMGAGVFWTRLSDH
jgi:hypothetical protein